MNILFKLFIIIVFITENGFSQTSGKISGKVIDKNTDSPLVGANVIIENTDLGAACDEYGEYFIINISLIHGLYLLLIILCPRKV